MKKRFPMPASLEHGPAVDKSVFMDAVRRKKGAITRENVLDTLRDMRKSRRARKLKKCYEILLRERGKRGMFPGYSWKGILSVITRYSGISKATIERAIYVKSKNVDNNASE